jgi:hypothetical protein
MPEAEWDWADPSEEAPVSAWWFEAPETERDYCSALAAAAAARFDDPERLYAIWRRDATSKAQRRYIEDLIRRVMDHLRDGTGARIGRDRALGGHT